MNPKRSLRFLLRVHRKFLYGMIYDYLLHLIVYRSDISGHRDRVELLKPIADIAAYHHEQEYNHRNMDGVLRGIRQLPEVANHLRQELEDTKFFRRYHAMQAKEFGLNLKHHITR